MQGHTHLAVQYQMCVVTQLPHVMLLSTTLWQGVPTSLSKVCVWGCEKASIVQFSLELKLASSSYCYFIALQNNKMNQQETTMTLTRRYPRFEITINTDHGSFTHISSAPKQADAVERVVRSYSKKNPVVSKIKPLGIIRQKAK